MISLSASLAMSAGQVKKNFLGEVMAVLTISIRKCFPKALVVSVILALYYAFAAHQRYLKLLRCVVGEGIYSRRSSSISFRPDLLKYLSAIVIG